MKKKRYKVSSDPLILGSYSNHPISHKVKQVLRTRNRSHFRRLAFQQQGQAVVEYVLLLIVTISLLMAFKSSFKKLDDFMYQFMGGYISCLMEYGELPSKGVQDTHVDQHNPANGGGKVCDSKFAGFAIATGRPPINSTSTASSSNSSSTSQSANGSKNSSESASQASTKTNDAQSKSGTESVVNGSTGQNANSNSPYTSGGLKRSSGSDSGSIADGSSTSENAKVKVINQDESDAARRGRLGDGAGRSRRTVYDRNQYRAITGQELADIEKQNKILRLPSTAVIPLDEEGRMGPRKSFVTPPEIKTGAAEKADDNQMNFGYFMKWLIIAAMAIAIFLFFGSQVMSFMNSQEK